MSKTKYLVGAGVLALTFALSTTASAQTTGEPHIIAAPSQFGGLRAAQQGDNDVRGFPLSKYHEFNAVHKISDPGDAEFNAIFQDNRDACQKVGTWIRESIYIQNEAKRLGLETVEIRNDLVALGSDLKNAAAIRTGGNLLGTGALCALSGGWYCGAALLFGIGNEVTGRANSKQAKINRKQSLNTADLTILNTRAMVLHTQMSIGWAKMVNGYCLKYHTDATIGLTTGGNVPETAPVSKAVTHKPGDRGSRRW